MSDMDELIAFYRARLEEEGCIVRAAFIDSSRPPRELRDVEADRKLIAAYEQAAENAKHPDYEGAWEYGSGLEDAVKIRAERFSDHPDYQESWKP